MHLLLPIGFWCRKWSVHSYWNCKCGCLPHSGHLPWRICKRINMPLSHASMKSSEAQQTVCTYMWVLIRQFCGLCWIHQIFYSPLLELHAPVYPQNRILQVLVQRSGRFEVYRNLRTSVHPVGPHWDNVNDKLSRPPADELLFLACTLVNKLSDSPCIVCTCHSNESGEQPPHKCTGDGQKVVVMEPDLGMGI